MLTELRIRNFAIIDELIISFDEGLSVISGETGAGKSIIIGAVSLLLGDRASADMIRSSEESALVEALFDIRGRTELKKKLVEMGLGEGDELIIRRVVSRTGKNRVYLNGNLANLAALSALAEPLINICSQHEHQLILDDENHIDILDEFGGLMTSRAEYTAVYDDVQSLTARLRDLEAMNAQKSERQDLLRFQMDEIDQASLKVGEEETLSEEKKVLSNVQKLMDYAGQAFETLYGREGSVLGELRNVVANVREIKKIDNGLSLSDKDLDSLYFQLEDIALLLRDYTNKLFYDPDRLETIENRLELIRKLKRKYGKDIETVLRKQAEMKAELAGMASVDKQIEMILIDIASRKEELGKKAEYLSFRRREAATRLAKAIEKEIRLLRMEEAKFDVSFKESPGTEPVRVYHPKGIDRVEFYLSTNIGEDMKPLNRIASGGELSRIILAMKKVLAKAGAVGTIIFDEVDSGIGGATAQVVGEKIRDVAQHHQVLCITHLPQIACYADRHYRVSKTIAGKRTNTRVEILAGEERLDEIARMLGGVEVTDTTRRHAREMLLQSNRNGRH